MRVVGAPAETFEAPRLMVERATISSMRSAVLVALLAACTRIPARTTAPAERLGPPDGDHATIERTRDRFMQSAARAGLTLRFVPEIREWTRPSLISWREEAHAVAIPRWQELGDGAKRSLDQIAGSRPAAEMLFAWLFRWFFVPHELTHAFQTNLGGFDDHAVGERLANDVAVAFYMEEPGGPARLAELAAMVESLLTRLPPIPADGDAYFNAHYDELGTDPVLYGSFQLRFVHDSLLRRHELRFVELAATRLRRPAH